MQQYSHHERECRNQCCQEERVAAAEEAATAEAEQLQEIASLKKELVATKRKLVHLTENFENSCRDNDTLRQRDLGLFYPKMDYMGVQMPGDPDEKTIGQHLSENPEVILICKYCHVSLIHLQMIFVRAGLFIVTHRYFGIPHRATEVPPLSST